MLIIAALLFLNPSLIHRTFIDSQSMTWHSITEEFFSWHRGKRESLSSLIVKMCFFPLCANLDQIQTLIDTRFNKMFHNDIHAHFTPSFE